jgi:hypothetical protein
MQYPLPFCAVDVRRKASSASKSTFPSDFKRPSLYIAGKKASRRYAECRLCQTSQLIYEEISISEALGEEQGLNLKISSRLSQAETDRFLV